MAPRSWRAAGPISLAGDIQNDSLDVPEGPLILTFTFKLPFTLGIEDPGHTDLAVAGSWADPDDIANFGKTPIVRVRQHNEPTDGIEFSPTRASNALQEFFEDLDESVKEVQFAAIPDAYEQWGDARDAEWAFGFRRS